MTKRLLVVPDERGPAEIRRVAKSAGRVATCFIVLLIVGGCSSNPGNTPLGDFCSGPTITATCGSDYRSTDQFVIEDSRIYGWNVKVARGVSRERIEEIAEHFASLQQVGEEPIDAARRILLFYWSVSSDAGGGFGLVPSDLDDPVPRPVDPENWIATVDYVGSVRRSTIWRQAP